VRTNRLTISYASIDFNFEIDVMFKKIINFFKSENTIVTHTNTITLSASDLQNSPAPNYFDDVISGLEFNATLQLRTPLRVLTRHGEQYKKNDGKQPKIAQDEWEGIWVPKLKSWEEIGLTLPNIPKGTSASDIGQVYDEDYLPFLIEVRKIVELNESIEERIIKIYRHPLTDNWTNHVNAHGGLNNLAEKFFPFFLNTIPKLTDDSIEKLKELGLDTPNAIAQTQDDVLLGINGIGKAKLKTIRDYCISITKNRDSNRVDTVER
jgi:hypothetical protein